jgi:hypothetical protein
VLRKESPFLHILIKHNGGNEKMGVKFCNLNVYGKSMEQAQEITSKYKYYSVSQDWITVTSDYFQWGDTQEHAKKLSEKLSAAVLSTEYFDDDYVEFAVYENGKILTRHVPTEYEGLMQQQGDAKQFIHVFHLDVSDEETLIKIFEVEDCESSVYLMESILGCPIYGIDSDFPPEEAPDRSIIEEFKNRN